MLIQIVHQYLSIPTHGAINRRPFLGLAEERIVWVAAPQLLTWVKRAILQGTERGSILQLKVLLHSTRTHRVKVSQVNYRETAGMRLNTENENRDEKRNITTTITTTVYTRQEGHRPRAVSLHCTLRSTETH